MHTNTWQQVSIQRKKDTIEIPCIATTNPMALLYHHRTPCQEFILIKDSNISMLLFSKFVESPLIYSDGLNLVPGNISLSLRDGHIIQLRQRPGLPYLSCFMTKVAMPHEGTFHQWSGFSQI